MRVNAPQPPEGLYVGICSTGARQLHRSLPISYAVSTAAIVSVPRRQRSVNLQYALGCTVVHSSLAIFSNDEACIDVVQVPSTSGTPNSLGSSTSAFSMLATRRFPVSRRSSQTSLGSGRAFQTKVTERCAAVRRGRSSVTTRCHVMRKQSEDELEPGCARHEDPPICEECFPGRCNAPDACLQ